MIMLYIVGLAAMAYAFFSSTKIFFEALDFKDYDKTTYWVGLTFSAICLLMGVFMIMVLLHPMKHVSKPSQPQVAQEKVEK
jgi:hypothetical protein